MPPLNNESVLHQSKWKIELFLFHILVKFEKERDVERGQLSDIFSGIRAIFCRDVLWPNNEVSASRPDKSGVEKHNQITRLDHLICLINLELFLPSFPEELGDTKK